MGQIVSNRFDLADCAEVWATRVAAAADLPDKRLNTRLARVLSTLARHPKDAIPQAAGNAAGAKTCYRFFANRRFEHLALVEALGEATAQACVGLDFVYVAHDSSSLNFSSLQATVGLGRLGAGETAAGLLLHSALAISPEGIVRGLLSVDLWARPLDQKTKEQRYDRPFEDKESFKWIRGMRTARAAFADAGVTPGPRRIHLMDREGDIHEVFADIVAHGEGAIIRCAQDRTVDGPIPQAHAAVAASPRRGTLKLSVRNRDGTTRKATVELRAVAVVLTPNSRDYAGRPPLPLHLVEVRQTAAPARGTPIHWLLWTTEPIATADDLRACVRAYGLRWRIEEYHLTLKSGCNTEQLQLETMERLCKAIVLYAAVATRIVALRDLGRHMPDAPCTVLLSAEECEVLTLRYASEATADGTTPTIRQAMLWIGRLGGHLGRKHDGLPGVRTLWRGWRDLAILVHGYRLRRRHKSL